MWCGPNDGGIKRGDRAETGDEQARPTAKRRPADKPADESLEDLTEVTGDYPGLGLTRTADQPAEDWAADTGPSRNPRETDTKTDRQADRSSTLKNR